MSINAGDLFRHLEKKLQSQTDVELAQALGMRKIQMQAWRSEGKELSALQVANIVSKATEHTKQHIHRTAIRAIVEFFPITPTPTKTGGNQLRVFDAAADKGRYSTELQKVLNATKAGIYIFYDTRGRALYAGQTKKQNIWKEMNLAFNRDRSTQVMTLVKHPINNVEFKPAHQYVRQPHDRMLRLHDLAAYFSAYEIIPEMVDDIEALLVRAFPNDLLNFKMERFGKGISKDEKAKALPKAKAIGKV
ncbi:MULTISPECIES: hypothetical protein [unclassified Acidovorax]|uniref:hypothetical protein n=1 Tax=unclassified Acidovorax TaxID=2684926 RepID=UPI001C440B9A|nr:MULTISPECIES: hypothetical protein [unclassified Acidovorax]MBV7460485.1 hypothetical protein [Acidovorax sp. sif0632]MBV7465510.1 hypothetical protein [Acidovorax sp. sif0613]